MSRIAPRLIIDRFSPPGNVTQFSESSLASKYMDSSWCGTRSWTRNYLIPFFLPFNDPLSSYNLIIKKLYAEDTINTCNPFFSFRFSNEKFSKKNWNGTNLQGNLIFFERQLSNEYKYGKSSTKFSNGVSKRESRKKALQGPMSARCRCLESRYVS